MNELAATIFEKALEAAPTSVIITDCRQPDNPIVFVNRAFEELTGYKREEVLGLNPRFLHGEDRDGDQPCHAELRSAIASGRECKVCVKDYRKDGTAYWSELSITPIFDEKQSITHYIGIERDITAEVILEQWRQRELSMAMVAHDVKTPIIGVGLILEHILDGRCGGLQPAVRELLTMLLHSNRQLLTMIHNMLDSYRCQQTGVTVSLESIDLPAVIADAITEVALFARSQRCQLIVEIQGNLPPCCADRCALTRVIINLLDNAIKYSAKGGVVRILADTDGDTFVIKISDSGPGVPADIAKCLFKPFNRPAGNNTKVPGWGLGLFVCQKFVEAHKGQISCDNHADKGTTFTIVLPRGGREISCSLAS